jgi:predicted permease
MGFDRLRSIIRIRLRTLFDRRGADRDLDDELSHLEQAAARHESRGLSPKAARPAARLAIGGLEQRKEECRDRRGFAPLVNLVRDLRFATRLIARRPGFSTLAILTLALGIGASTAIFAIVNGVLLQPLPFPDAHRLMLISSSPVSPAFPVASGLEEQAFLTFEARTTTFEDVALFTMAPAVITGAAEPARIQRAIVTADLFAVLRIAPAVGRGFSRSGDRAGAPEIVISDALWHTLFAGDRDVIGRRVTIDGESHDVVGIMPAGFAFPDDAEAWTHLEPGPPRGGNAWLRPSVGRLNAGSTVQQAQFELETLTRPADSTPATWQVRVTPLKDRLVGDIRRPLLVLTAAVGFVLLVACVNVGNLLLIRMSERRRELTVRASLGAGRGRIVQQLLSESLVLTSFAAALGVILAAVGLPALLALAPAGAIPRIDLIVIDRTALLFTGLLSLATTLAFGVLPAFRASRQRHGLVPLSRTVIEGRERLYSALVVTEIAVSVILLAGAGLMLKAFLNLRAVDTGFTAVGVSTATVDLPAGGYKTAEQAQRFYAEALAALQRLPAIDAVGAINWLPFGAMSINGDFALEGGRVPSPPFNVEKPAVSADYFRAMGIRVVRGRVFSRDDDAAAMPVAVVSESAARSLWPGEDPLGRRISLRNPPRSEADWLTVVGVVADVRQRSLADAGSRTVYQSHPQVARLPFLQHGSFVIRSVVDRQLSAANIKAALRTVDPQLPVPALVPMEARMAMQTRAPAFQARVLSIFAAIATALTIIGLYGVLAFSVSRRAREFAIRMALGAGAGRLVGVVVRKTFVLAALGVTIGAAGASGLTRLIERQLFGVTPTDPATFVTVTLLMVAAALAAAAIPAWRAARIDPTAVLSIE